MSSKEQKPSKKAVRVKKEKTIEDATFGLKNKNKSKKVQQFINRVEKSVKNQNGGLDQVIIWIIIINNKENFVYVNGFVLGKGEGSKEG